MVLPSGPPIVVSSMSTRSCHERRGRPPLSWNSSRSSARIRSGSVLGERGNWAAIAANSGSTSGILPDTRVAKLCGMVREAVALVTGGASGIGAAVTAQLREAGRQVVVLDINEPNDYRCDVSDP